MIRRARKTGQVQMIFVTGKKLDFSPIIRDLSAEFPELETVAYQNLTIEDDDGNQQELLYKELDKQYRKYSKKYDGYDLKQRLTQALARKGYDFSDIASALREYL